MYALPFEFALLPLPDGDEPNTDSSAGPADPSPPPESGRDDPLRDIALVCVFLFLIQKSDGDTFKPNV